METSFKFSGEPTAEALATGLATLGRYGDDHMVHASEGETFIPAEVFEANPNLKENLFAQMRMMGESNPERFVVGNALNSLNPITGQPEFFFKKIFKSIGKVFKKALPVIAPIVGNMIAPGIGGIIASGLVTKLQGGSWGDVLKGAAVGWATQGLTSGIGSLAGGENFFTGVGKGLRAPFGAASNLFSSGAANPLNQGIFGTAGLYGAKSAAGRSMFDYIAPPYDPNAQFAADLPQNLAPGATYTSSSGVPSKIVPGAADSFYGPALPHSEYNAGALYGDLGGSVPQPQYADLGMTGPSSSIPAMQPSLAAQDAHWSGGGGGDDFLMDVPVSDRPGIENLMRLESAAARGELGPRMVLDPKSGAMVPATSPAARDYRITETITPAGEGSIRPETTTQITPLGQVYTEGDIVNMPGGKQFQAQMSGSSVGKSGSIVPGGDLKFAEYEKPGILDWGLTDATQEGLESLGVGPKTAEGLAPYVKTAGIGAAGIAAVSLFDESEVPDQETQPVEYAAYDEWRGLSDKNSPEAINLFREWRGPAHVTRSAYESQTGGPSNKPDWWFLPEAARGGEIVGPGTGTSDSIPARLSDGEFVMTAEAVRNAGAGDRDLGAARMYDMMRRFEGGVG